METCGFPFRDFAGDVLRVSANAVQQMRADCVLKFQADEKQTRHAYAAVVNGPSFVKCGVGMARANKFVIGPKPRTPQDGSIRQADNRTIGTDDAALVNTRDAPNSLHAVAF